jgi:hypothetical protein
MSTVAPLGPIFPEGTVKSRLFRGRRLLQHRLRDYAEPMGYIKVLPLAS